MAVNKNLTICSQNGSVKFPCKPFRVYTLETNRKKSELFILVALYRMGTLFWHYCIYHILSLHLSEDFTLAGYAVYFNASSMEGDTRCFQFQPVNDTIVEGDEVMSFQVQARNPLDVFQDDEFSLTVFDNDGKA